MLNYITYRFGQSIALSFPLKTAYSIAVFLADVRYLFAFRDKRFVTENLKAIFPEKSEKEIAVIRRAMFRNFAKYLVDFFRFKKLDMEYVNKNIRFENIQHVKEGLKSGNGVILLTAHLGNWELGGVAIAMAGYPLMSVALPHKSKKVNEFFNSQRQSRGMGVLPLGNAAKSCLKTLKNNGLLALVGDRNFIGKGMIVDFFGKPAVFPTGPAFLSLHSKAKIVPGFMLRNGDDSFVIKFEPSLEYTPCGDDDKDLHEIIAKCKNVIENYIRKYPDQWYMFRRFWKE